MTKPDIKTLHFTIFKRRLTAEIRNYWYCRASFEYAIRWWAEENRDGQYPYLSHFPGDKKNHIFSSIDIAPSEFVDLRDQVLWGIRCNAVTNIVTAFETFLYYQLKRAIYLKPELIEKSGVEFAAGELASSYASPDHKEWLAEAVVSKYIRNNSHRKMIRKFDVLIKGGVVNGASDLIDRWCRKVTLRNALVHNAKLVTKELVEDWPERFSSTGVPIALDDGDVVRAHHVAYSLAKAIDEQVQRSVIGEEDARTLSRVIFLMYRKTPVGEVADMVFKLINFPCSKDLASSAITYQKKNRSYVPDFALIEEIVLEYQSKKAE